MAAGFLGGCREVNDNVVKAPALLRDPPAQPYHPTQQSHQQRRRQAFCSHGRLADVHRCVTQDVLVQDVYDLLWHRDRWTPVHLSSA